jgi:hypothetical protein
MVAMGCVLRNKELYSSPISDVVKHFGFAAYGAFWSVGLHVVVVVVVVGFLSFETILGIGL